MKTDMIVDTSRQERLTMTVLNRPHQISAKKTRAERIEHSGAWKRSMYYYYTVGLFCVTGLLEFLQIQSQYYHLS